MGGGDQVFVYFWADTGDTQVGGGTFVEARYDGIDTVNAYVVREPHTGEDKSAGVITGLGLGAAVWYDGDRSG